MAFLDYENSGNAYGKIYKVKMIQLKGVLEQEQQCKLYDTILIVDYVDSVEVYLAKAKMFLLALT